MKKYMIIVILILFSIVVLLIPNNIFSKKNKLEYGIIDESNPNYVYYLKNDEIVGVPIYTLSTNKYKLIEEVFEYLTSKSNSVSELYETTLNLSSQLLSYEIIGNKIFLDLSNEFMKTESNDIKYALAQIKYSYLELGFEEIYLKNNNKQIIQLNDYVLTNGIGDLPVNINIMARTNSRKVIKVNYFYKDKIKTFINYVIDDTTSEISFVLENLITFLDKEYQKNIELVAINYFDDTLTITIDADDLDQEIIKELIISNINEHKLYFNFN